MEDKKQLFTDPEVLAAFISNKIVLVVCSNQATLEQGRRTMGEYLNAVGYSTVYHSPTNIQNESAGQIIYCLEDEESEWDNHFIDFVQRRKM